MADPGTFFVWIALGVLVGWCTGQFLFGYRVLDDIIAGVFGSITGSAVAQALFGNALGGPLGSIAFGAALAISLILLLRVLPRHHFT
ncbi:MAG TPA: hypothetical protein VHX16_05050 [Chloroflexota bacterium]|nr:hypothetical protein [Chloroflexota bacterium]